MFAGASYWLMNHILLFNLQSTSPAPFPLGNPIGDDGAVAIVHVSLYHFHIQIAKDWYTQSML